MYKNFSKLLVLIAMFAVISIAHAQPAATALVPTQPGSQFIGETFSSQACFDNTGSTVGYQPVYRLIAPANITLAGANFPAGSANAVAPELIGTGPGTFTDPITGSGITLAAGERLYILRYPLGSVTPAQPVQCMDLNFALPLGTPIGTPINIPVTPIFSLGADALDNPISDPPVVGAPTNITVTPTVWKFKKVLLPPEKETATGPDWPRTFTLTVDVANGATVTGVIFDDVLPAQMQYVSFSTVGGTCTPSGLQTVTAAAPGGRINLTCGAVTGTGGATDLVVTVTYFVPKCETGAATAAGNCAGTKVLDPTTGAARSIDNTATATAAYLGTPLAPITSLDTFSAESQTVRKSVAITTDTAPAGLSPGDTLTYTITGEISDYFQFDNLIVRDVIGDGQTLVAGSTQLTFDNNSAVGAAQSSASAAVAAPNITQGPKVAATGLTPLTIRVSDEAVTRALDRIFRGRDSFGAVRAAQPARYTITYQTTVDRNYTAPQVGGTQPLSAGDTIVNNAASDANVSVGGVAGALVTNTSQTALTIAGGQIGKTIALINGAAPTASQRVKPGDTITYSILQTIPTPTYEDLKLDDFLPLPILKASQVAVAPSTAPPGRCANPPVGTWCLGPATNITAAPFPASCYNSPAITVTVDPAANSVRWDFPSCEPIPLPGIAAVVEVRFTVTVGSEPIADNLNLTNLSNASLKNSGTTTNTTTGIVQIKLSEPKLDLEKTIVQSSNGTSTCPAATAANTLGVKSCDNSDAGDSIRYRLRVRNTGHAPAFDVRLTDDLGGAAYTSCTINSVTNGAGTTQAFTGALTIASPLVLTASPSIPNNLDDTLDPAEVIWIDYSCTIPAAQNPRPGMVIPNIARITNYSNAAGGANFATNTTVGGPNASTATINLRGIQSIVKNLGWTSLASSTVEGNNAILNPGEQAQFKITVTLSEGIYNNFSLTDSISVIPALSACTTSANVTQSAPGAPVTPSACRISTNLTISGTTLTCAPTLGSVPCSIEVLTTPQTFITGVTNTGSVSSTNQPAQSSQQSLTVDPPNPTVNKAFSPTTGDAGDAVTVNLSWQNNDTDNPMFACVVTDNLTLTGTAPVTPTTAAVSLFNNATLAFLAPATGTPGYACTGYGTQNITCTSSTPATLSSYACTISAGIVTCTASDASIPCAASLTYASLQGTLSSTLSSGTAYTNTVGLVSRVLPATQGSGATVSASATAGFSSNVPAAPAKRVVATSLADTAGSNLAIGEIMTFELDFTVPEGVTPNVVLRDLITAGGLANFRCVAAAQSTTNSFCGAQLKKSTTGLTAANDPGAINAAATNSYVNVTVAENVGANDITLALGNVTRAASASPGTSTYTLKLELQAQNTASNQNGTALTDQVQLDYTNGAGSVISVTGPSQTATIVEPQIGVAKDVTPTSVQGGDTLTYSIVIRNTGAAPIYDSVVCDALPAELTTFGTPAFSVTTLVGAAPIASTPFSVTAGACGSASGNFGLRGIISQLDPGEVVTVTFTAVVKTGTAFGSSVTNTTAVDGSSLPGGSNGDVVGPSGAGTSNERTGKNNDSNFTANDPAVFTTRLLTFGKSIVSPKAAYAVGDVVRYRLQVGLPAGTTTNLKLEDTLPAGLKYGGNPLYTIPVTVTSTPNPPTVTTSATAPQVVWTFALLAATAPTDVLVEFDAIVENVIANQVGVNLANTARAVYDNIAGGTFTAVAPAPPAIQVGEPNLTIAKSITTSTTNLEAGATVGYQVDISNAGAANNTPAYRLRVTDVLPALMLNPNAFVITITGTGPASCPSGACLSGTATAVTASDIVAVAGSSVNPGPGVAGSWSIASAGTGIDLYPGVTLRVAHDARVDPNAPATSSIGANNVAGTYSSQKAVNADARDGSAPGSDDDDNTVLNNYNETASTPGFTLQSNVNIVKSLVAPASGNITIGQTVTYKLRVDLSQGTTQNVNVTDVVPPDLTYLAHRTTWGAGCTAAPNPARTGTGQNVSLVYGNVVCPANASLVDDYFEVEIDAKVDNVIINQQSRTLTNGGSSAANSAAGTNVFVTTGLTNVRVDADANGTIPGLQGVTVTIVEPTLLLTKTSSPLQQALGDDVIFTLTLQHAPGCTVDAYDVRVVDTLPANLTFVSSTPAMTGTGPYSLTIPTLSCGAVQTLLVRAKVSTGTPLPSTLTNTAAITWASVPGGNGAPNDGRNGQDGAGGLNDYTTSASAPVSVVDRRVLDATKTVAIVAATDAGNPGVLDPGEQVEYTIVVRNFDTTLTSTNTIFTDTIPANTSFVPGSITSVDRSGAAYGTPSFAANSVTVAIGAMAPATSTLASREVTIKFKVSVNAGTPSGTLIRNQGIVDSDQTPPKPTDQDGNGGNGDQPTDIFVGGPPPTAQPLYSTKAVARVIDADASSSTTVGDTMEYKLTVQNTGATPLLNVVLTDTWPAGLGYVAGSATPPAQTVIVAASRSITWTVPTLATGATATATFRVTVDSLSLVSPAGTFVNQGTVTAQTSTGATLTTQTDGNGSATDGNQPTTFLAGPTGSAGTPVMDLQKRVTLLTDANSNGQVNPGDTLQYTITLTNRGTGIANNTRIIDNPIPAQLTLVAGSTVTSRGAVISEAPTGFSVNVGFVNPGETVTVTFNARVNSGTAGQVAVNQALATGDNFSNLLSDDNANTTDGRNPNQTPIYDPATPNAGSPTVTKALIATSETGSAGNTVLIGEVVTYTLTATLPRGNTNNLTLVDTLPVGQRFIPGSATLTPTFDTALNSSINPVAVNAAASGAVLALPASALQLGVTAGGNQVVSLPLGNVINSDSDSAPQIPETYKLTYKVLVENIASNLAGVTLTNGGALTFNNLLNQPVTLTPQTVTTTIIEPKLAVAKTSNVGTVLVSGGTVRFTLTVTNSSAAGNVATAYNVNLKDALPAAFTSYTLASTTPSGGVVGVTNVSAGSTLEFNVAAFPPDGTLEIVFDAIATGPLTSGSSIINTANVNWTSLPGSNGTGGATPGAPGTPTGERTGAGGGTPNTYANSGSNTIRIGVPTITKSVVAPRTQYAVGEDVTYKLVVSYPPVSLAGNLIADTFPAGLEFVAGSLGVVTQPNLTLTPATATLTVSGNTVTFNLGQVDNPDTTVRTVELTYRARVRNVLSNQSGTSLTNNAVLSYIDPTTNASVNSAAVSQAVRVGEPAINLTKVVRAAVNPLIAGSVVRYAITVENMGNTPAFEQVVTDVLPSVLSGVANVSITPTFAAASALYGASTLPTVPAAQITAFGWSSTPFQLNPGDSVEIAFDATVQNNIVPGQSFVNNASSTFTSMLGTNAGERDGSTPNSVQTDGLLNNYNTSAVVSLSAGTSISLAKAFNSTSAVTSTNTQYAIGEIIAYRLRISLAPGTYNSVVINDVLPTGFSYVSHSLALGHGAITPANTAGVTFTQTGQNLTFNFGTVVNPARTPANPATDFLDLILNVRVDNVLANENSATRTNSATLSNTPATGTPVTGAPQAVTAVLVEPVLRQTKSALPTTPTLGDEVTYTVRVTHDAASTANAYNVVIKDVLPAGLTLVAGSASLTPDASSSGQNIQWTVPSLALTSPGFVEITFRAKVALTAPIGVPLTNTASVAYSSTPGVGGRTGVDGVGGLNDYFGTSSAAITPADTRSITASKTVALVIDADNSASLTPNDTLEYTIVLTNTSAAAQTNTIFTDTVPLNTVYVVGSMTSSQGTIVDTAAPLRVVIGTMAPAQVVTIKFRVKVSAGTAPTTVIRNQGSVDSDQVVPTPTDDPTKPGTADPTDIALAGLPGAQNPAIAATKSVALLSDTVPAVGTINVGDTVMFTIALSNVGNVTLTNVTFTDVVPTGLTVLTVSPNASFVGNTVAASIASLPVNSVETIMISARADAVGNYNNQGSVTTTQTPTPTLTDGDPGTPGEQPTPIPVLAANASGAPLLVVTKAVAISVDGNLDGKLNPSETIRYTIVIRNTGTVTATNVVLTDALPAGLNLISVTPSQGAVTTGTSSAISVNIGTITVSGSATVTIVVGVPASTAVGTLFTNTASASAAGLAATQSVPVSILVEAATQLSPPAGLKIGTFQAYPELLWRMVWVNSANSVALVSRIVDPIGANQTYVAGSIKCEPTGTTTVTRCEYDPATNKIIVETKLGADPGKITEATAANELVISFRVKVTEGIFNVSNDAQAFWDSNSSGGLDDDLLLGQTAVVVASAANAPAIQTPTLSTWALWLLCLVLGHVGMRSIRQSHSHHGK